MSHATSQQQLSEFVRNIYQTNDFIPLHAPTFDEFEQRMQAFTGATRAIATVNGTAALHTALYMAGVKRGDFVITQALTFVATCNAMYHMGAEPIFVDVAPSTLGLCPTALEAYLSEHARLDGERIISMEEKPIQRFFVNAGIYVISPEIFKNVEKQKRIDMPTLMQTYLDANEDVFMFPIHEYWLDIGRMDDFKRAQVDIKGLGL